MIFRTAKQNNGSENLQVVRQMKIYARMKLFIYLFVFHLTSVIISDYTASVRSEVFRAVTINMGDFYNVTPCILTKLYRSISNIPSPLSR